MKILLYLAKGFETMEASVFIDVMGWARNDYNIDVEVVTCGKTPTVNSAFDVPVTVDILADKVNVSDYDALAIPGGFEEYGFFDEVYTSEVAGLIKSFNDSKKPIATVCVGALAVAHTGILSGKEATTYHLGNGRRQRQLAEYGAVVVNDPVVVTDNIITSYCPQTAPEVAFTLLGMLVGNEKMQIVKTAMGF